MKNAFSYLSYIFLILILGFSIFISWFLSGLSFIFSLFLYGLIFYVFHIAWRKLRRRERLSLQAFFPFFLKKISGLLFLLLIIIWWFWYYHNFYAPAYLPLYTLSNGTQTIRFQTMAHIASKNFYDTVINNIQNAKRENYVLYFEWVTPGSRENTEAFNTALGINLGPDTYQNLSTLYGTEAQNNEDFLNIINNKDYNIDLSIDEIMALYNERNILNWSASINEEVYDVSEELFSRLSKLNQKQLTLLRFINQAFLNFIMKNDSLRDGIIENFWNTDIFSVILDDRNLHIVNAIESREDEKIFIIYGLMHFEWVYDILKKRDPNWEIIKKEDFKALSLF